MCDCIKRTGSIITDVRNVGFFDQIISEDNLSIYVIQDSVYEVRVTAGENVVPLIRTEVVDGILTIKNDNRCNWTRSYKKPLNVTIRVPTLKYITSKGTGNIMGVHTFTVDTIDLETKNSGDIEFTFNSSKITTHMFGYGDITLHGTTAEHACSIGGDGFLYASDLIANYTWIQTFTSGFCYIYASDLLICRIDKTGDVYCYGNPTTVQSTRNGTGQLYLY